MKKLILASVFVLGATFAVSAQNSTDTKSCNSDKGKKSCCQSTNSVNSGTSTTTTTTTTKSCCSNGGSHHSSTNSSSTGTSAYSVINSNKTVVEGTTNTEEPKK